MKVLLSVKYLRLTLSGAYLPQNLHTDLNWKPFHGEFIEFAPGINLRHAPGHTPGLTMMQLNLKNSGPWLFTTDQYHVKANYEQDVPQGWLARDHDDWCRSHQMVKMLVKNIGAKIVFGHDEEVRDHPPKYMVAYG